MQNFDKYCQALGVSPGDGPEAVKQAFRSRIKQHHPDAQRGGDSDSGSSDNDSHSRLLIEAYTAFKKGVPCQPASSVSSSQTTPQGRPAPQRGTDGFAGFGNPFRDPSVDPREAGRRFAEAAYEAHHRFHDQVGGRGRSHHQVRGNSHRTVWTAPDENSPLGDVYVNLSDMIWGDDPRTEVYGKHARVREYQPSHGGPAVDGQHPYDQAIEYYTRAEAGLRETVRRFERRSNRFKTNWIRDYIGELARVQVLFRDVSKRYPALSGKSLARVRQISELITEIKKSRTA